MGELAFKIYSEHQKVISAVAKKYSKIDPALNYEDLMSEGYIALMDAIESYDPAENLSFTSYLWWQLQKRFHSILGKDKVVEIKFDGKNKLVSYEEFLRIKRSLPERAEWRVVSLKSPIELEIEEIGRDNPYGKYK